MSQSRLIITQQKTPLWYCGWGVLAAALLVASYFLGRLVNHESERQALEKVIWLENELDKFQSAYQQANQDLIMQAQTAKVDNQSNQQLVETVKQMQQTQLSLESELSFYRKIMAPELDQEGLTIADFQVTASNQKESFNYKLVLTQAGKQDQFLKGRVSLVLHGKLAGETKAYQFRELGTFQSKDFQFQFRYFQNLEGEIAIPADFIAEKVEIEAKTSGLRKNQSAQYQFIWNI
ncbi:DUF6776 family protein [Aliikangiella sp. IMCC44653]